MNKRMAGLVSALIFAAAMAGWLFQWQYGEIQVPGERIGSYQVTQSRRNVRTNRWTGEAQILTSSGWVPMDRADPLAAAFRGLEK